MEPGVRISGPAAISGALCASSVELVQVRAVSVRGQSASTNAVGSSIVLGAASLPLVTLYPFMKRITYWPQAVLGK